MTDFNAQDGLPKNPPPPPPERAEIPTAPPRSSPPAPPPPHSAFDRFGASNAPSAFRPSANSWTLGAPVQELWKSFARRVTGGDLSLTEPRPEEAQWLSERGITGATARLAVWRRAMMAFALLTYGVVTAIGLVNWVEGMDSKGEEFAHMGPLGGELHSTFKVLTTLLFLPSLVACYFIFRALKVWDDTAQSRRHMLFALAFAFLPPIILALFPWTKTMDLSAYLEEGPKTSARMTGGFIIALAFFMKIGPAIIGVCSGVVRGSLVLKTLLPQSAWPAWVAILFGPLYALLILVTLLFLVQSSGDFLLVCAVLALGAAPLVYLRRAKDIMRPHTAEEVHAIVNPVRKQAQLVNGLGVLFLGIFLANTVETISEVDAIAFLFGALSSSILMTLVVTDGMLCLVAAGWRQDREFQGTPLVSELDQTMAGLRESRAL